MSSWDWEDPDYEEAQEQERSRQVKKKKEEQEPKPNGAGAGPPRLRLPPGEQAAMVKRVRARIVEEKRQAAMERWKKSQAAGVSKETHEMDAGAALEPAVPSRVLSSRPLGAGEDFDRYEAALMVERMKAVEAGILPRPIFDAWLALSQDFIQLGPELAGGVDPALKARAFAHAQRLFLLLKNETAGHERVMAAGVFADVTHNRYTDEWNSTAPFFHQTQGAGPLLAGAIDKGAWGEAVGYYQRLVAGLDQWIADQLKKQQGEHAPGAERVEVLAGRKRELGALEGKGAKAVAAVFYPDAKYQKEPNGEKVREVPLALYYWKEDAAWHLRDVTSPEHPFEDTRKAAPGEKEPPPELFWELNTKVHFVKGVIDYRLPNGRLGQVLTEEWWSWHEYLAWLGVGLAVVGLGLVTLGSGAVAVAGAWALAGSGVIGATAAAGELHERAQHGALDETTAVLDIGQIVAGLAGVAALGCGKIVVQAAEASAPARWAGAAARLAVVADRLYLPLVATSAGADVVTFAVFTVDAAQKLDAIEHGPGRAEDKRRAIAQLVAQFALLGGLTALSVRGTLPSLVRGRTLVIHPGPDGVPVVSAMLGPKSVVIDTQVAIALQKRADGKSLHPNELVMLERIDALGEVDLRVTDKTAAEVRGTPTAERGLAVSVDRNSREYQELLAELAIEKVGKSKGAADREIVADTFFAVTEPGVKPALATRDGGIYNNLYRLRTRTTGELPPEKLGSPLTALVPNGFDVTVRGKTIHILPLPKQ